MNAEQIAPTNAGPRTPSPCDPNRSGSFKSAAAPMIGVASRNANRAASSFESPAISPPAIVAPDRENPGINASACAAPTPSADRNEIVSATRASASASSPSGTTGARRRSTSAPASRNPFRVRKIAADCGRREDLPQRVLQQQPEDARRDRAHDQEPAELRVDVVGGDLAPCERAPETAHDAHPVAPEEARATRSRSRGASRSGTSGSTDRSGGCPSRRSSGGSRCARGSRWGTARSRPAAARG